VASAAAQRGTAPCACGGDAAMVFLKPAGASATRNVTHVLGVPIDRLTETEFLSRMDELIRSGQPHMVLYVNADGVNQAVLDRRYAKILQEADLVCADGMGVVWASKLTGEALPERINMGDMLEPVCELASRNGYRVFLLGGAPGVVDESAKRLQRRFANLQIVGCAHGFFGEAEEPALLRRIRHARPHLVIVGMGVPKQEKWIWQHREELGTCVLWGVGAAIDYHAGRVLRAPVWMRRIGLEWCFRLVVEPKRLWRRYLLGNAFFIGRAFALLLADAALVTTAWFGAYHICSALGRRVGLILNPLDPYLMGAPLIVGIWLINCAAFGLYRRTASMSALAELAQVIRATWLGLLSTLAVAFLFRELSFGRPVVFLAAPLTLLLLSISRLVARGIERRLARRGIGLRRVLIVGTGPLAKRLREEIEIWPIGYDVVGFVRDNEGSGQQALEQVLGSLHDLGVLIRKLQIQDVFVASQNLGLHQELNLLAEEEQWPVNFHVVSDELEAFARRVPLDRLLELPLLQLPYAKVGRGYEATKRLFDLVVTLLLLALCLPVALVITLAITLESPGPAVFAQQRVGRLGRLFTMYKFRTMRADADAYAIAPNALDDPRVTRLGRWLRRWSLDELPQLLNVLTGEMSLVGPRPEMPFLVQQYEPWQLRRLAVRPGLTGLWQVVGRKELPLHRHIEYDLYYVRHRGWLLDLAILLRSFPAVLFRRGAL